MKMSDFTPEEQAEIVSAVHDASVDPDGDVRPLEDARIEFDRYMASAVQAHRAWAAKLLDGWRVDGERAFIKHVRKSDAFRFAHQGKIRRRSLRRGTRTRDESGQPVWVQTEILTWTAAQLENAIKESVRRIDEERANIAMYRALLDLLEETGAVFVNAALEQRDQTLEEFLAERAA
jgi:hypothetical protein